jgi:hypothetical protein
VKYLNDVIEQDHRFIKKKVRASQCFKRFHTAERTLEGIEAVNMMRKGQVKRLAGSDARGQATFVASLFGVAAWRKALEEFLRLKIIFATQPVDLLKWNAEGEIVEFKVFIRPLKAVNLIHQKMAATLQAKQ